MRRTSVMLGKPGGVPVHVHWSLSSLLLGGLCWAGLTGGWAGLAGGAWLVVVLSGSVLLHELGHAWVASRHGVPTQRIVLYPTGGVAEMAIRRVSPQVDAAISVAGPLVSLGVALLCAALGTVSGLAGLWHVATCNAVLGVFNLLPLYPLDGGRLLRAALIPRVGVERAVALTLNVGMAGGILGVLVALWSQLPDLVLVSLFMMWMLQRERDMGLSTG